MAEKPRKRDRLTSYLQGELKELIGWFRHQYPLLSESQVGGLALKHYIQEVQARGIDPRTLLPVSENQSESKKVALASKRAGGGRGSA